MDEHLKEELRNHMSFQNGINVDLSAPFIHLDEKNNLIVVNGCSIGQQIYDTLMKYSYSMYLMDHHDKLYIYKVCKFIKPLGIDDIDKNNKLYHIKENCDKFNIDTYI